MAEVRSVNKTDEVQNNSTYSNNVVKNDNVQTQPVEASTSEIASRRQEIAISTSYWQGRLQTAGNEGDGGFFQKIGDFFEDIFNGDGAPPQPTSPVSADEILDLGAQQDGEPNIVHEYNREQLAQRFEEAVKNGDQATINALGQAMSDAYARMSPEQKQDFANFLIDLRQPGLLNATASGGSSELLKGYANAAIDAMQNGYTGDLTPWLPGELLTAVAGNEDASKEVMRLLNEEGLGRFGGAGEDAINAFFDYAITPYGEVNGRNSVETFLQGADNFSAEGKHAVYNSLFQYGNGHRNDVVNSKVVEYFANNAEYVVDQAASDTENQNALSGFFSNYAFKVDPNDHDNPINRQLFGNYNEQTGQYEGGALKRVTDSLEAEAQNATSAAARTSAGNRQGILLGAMLSAAQDVKAGKEKTADWLGAISANLASPVTLPGGFGISDLVGQAAKEAYLAASRADSDAEAIDTYRRTYLNELQEQIDNLIDQGKTEEANQLTQFRQGVVDGFITALDLS